MPISLPKFLLTPFADAGARANIPQASDQPAGRAGYDVGFPPVNMTPVAAGGIPPFGQDMNGILFDLSKAIQYTQSGVNFPFDSAFATAIGGYPIGALVSDATDKSLLWINGTANNTAYPTGWVQVSLKQATETVQGTAKISTQALVDAGADDLTVVSPLKMREGLKTLGLFKKYTNTTASHALGVTYTNSSGRDKKFMVTFTSTAAGYCQGIINVDGGLLGSSNVYASVANTAFSIYFEVPNGSTYQMVNNLQASLNRVMEK